MAASLLGLVALAGCLGSEEGENRAPSAQLEASKDVGMTGEQFTFDAQDSSDPDGEIKSWRFDFGDGTTMEVDDVEDARVQHTYARGGEFVVTVTVTDDGAEDEGALSDTEDTKVAVNEEFPVAGEALYSSPLPNQTEQSSTPFEAHDGSDRFQLELDVRSILLTGSSEIKVEVIDANGDVAGEETVTVPAGEEDTVEINGLLVASGQGEVRLTAQSGAAFSAGNLTVYYDDGF